MKFLEDNKNKLILAIITAIIGFCVPKFMSLLQRGLQIQTTQNTKEIDVLKKDFEKLKLKVEKNRNDIIILDKQQITIQKELENVNESKKNNIRTIYQQISEVNKEILNIYKIKK